MATNYTSNWVCIRRLWSYTRHIKLDLSADNRHLVVTTAQHIDLDKVAADAPKDRIKDGAIIAPELSGKQYLMHSNELDLDVLQTRRDWKEHSKWILPYAPFGRETEGNIRLLNTTARGSASHTPPDTVLREFIDGAMQLYVPFKDSDFSEISLCLYMLHCDGDEPKVYSNRTVNLIKSNTLWVPAPYPKLTGPMMIEKDGKVEIQVSHRLRGSDTPTGRATTIYLTGENGYLPKTRLDLPTGEGKFTVMSTGLESGDKIRVKAGFYFHSGLSEHVITVE